MLEDKQTSGGPERPVSSGGLSPLPANRRKVAVIVFGASGTIVLLAALVWYSFGLPGASPVLQRALGRLPEAGERLEPPSPRAETETRGFLTGLPCGEAYKRRPIAVMIGSDPRARPLSGFAGADLVLEMPVLTNNVTRLMAVYQCGHPPEIGGVRSARHDYLFLAKGLDAVLAHWGGSYHALNRIRGERRGGASVYETIDAMIRTASGAYYRVSKLPAPYNGYTTYDRLWTALRSNGYRTYTRFAYPHRPELPLEQRGSGTLDVGWPGALRVRYVYRPEMNGYERFWGGTRHLDGVGDAPVNPRALIVMHTEQRFAQGPGGYNDVDVEGSGKVELYQNGQVLEGVWEKSAVHKQDPLIFRTALGQPMEFIPGQVWIHVVDGRTPVVWTPGIEAPPDLETSKTPTHLGD